MAAGEERREWQILTAIVWLFVREREKKERKNMMTCQCGADIWLGWDGHHWHSRRRDDTTGLPWPSCHAAQQYGACMQQ